MKQGIVQSIEKLQEDIKNAGQDYSEEIEGLQEGVAANAEDIEGLGEDVEDLDERVTALEQGGGGSVSSVSWSVIDPNYREGEDTTYLDYDFRQIIITKSNANLTEQDYETLHNSDKWKMTIPIKFTNPADSSSNFSVLIPITFEKIVSTSNTRNVHIGTGYTMNSTTPSPDAMNEFCCSCVNVKCVTYYSSDKYRAYFTIYPQISQVIPLN